MAGLALGGLLGAATAPAWGYGYPVDDGHYGGYYGPTTAVYSPRRVVYAEGPRCTAGFAPCTGAGVTAIVTQAQ